MRIEAAAAVRTGTADGTAGATRAFEGLFLRLLVSELRTSDGGAGLFGQGPGSGVMEDWFDAALADHLAQSGRIGLAADLRRAFGRS